MLIFFIFFLIIGVALAISGDAWNEFFNIEGWSMLLLGTIGISLMVMLIAFFSEYYEFYVQQKVFGKVPFASLASIGFHRTKLFETTFWKLHKEVYVAMFNNYLVIADVPHKKAVTFTFLTTSRPSLSMMASEYREIVIHPVSAGFVMEVPVDTYSTPTIDELQKLLRKMSSTLSAYHCQPQHSLKGYESMVKTEMLRKGLSTG